MAIKTEMLRCFAAVARTGNLTDAAVSLGRTPSAVSLMLKQFQDHLGGPLFESERKSKLTQLGTFVLDQAIGQLEHFDRTIANIEGYSNSQSGLVRVAAVPSVAEKVLPQVVCNFCQDRPGVSIDIRDMDSAGVLRELERGQVDIGLATGTGAGLVSEPLFSDEFGIVCRADHPLTKIGHPLEWNELERYRLIANGICARIADQEFQSLLAKSQLMVRNTTSLLALVRAGAGVSVLPRLVVSERQHDVAFLTVADAAARREIYILRRQQTAPAPVVRAFVADVRKTANAIVG